MLKIDLHMHTVASGHAQNSILEYVSQAKKLKMKVIGISDHGPEADSLTTQTYFSVLDRLPRIINGITVLRGAEANIISPNGEIDIFEKAYSRLDYVMVGFHPPYKSRGADENTETMIKAINRGKIKIITHPFVTHLFPMNVGKISEAACSKGVLLEVNLHYIKRFLEKREIMRNLKEMIQVVRSRKKQVIVGSDAHNIWELGNDYFLKKVRKEIGLTDQMIINRYPNKLFEVLKLKL